MDNIVYITANILITPLYEGKEKKKDEIQWQSIPIYLLGSITYMYIDDLPFIDKKYQELTYKVLFNTFGNCLIYENFREVLINTALVAGSVIVSNLHT